MKTIANDPSGVSLLQNTFSQMYLRNVSAVADLQKFRIAAERSSNQLPSPSLSSINQQWAEFFINKRIYIKTSKKPTIIQQYSDWYNDQPTSYYLPWHSGLCLIKG